MRRCPRCIIEMFEDKMNKCFVCQRCGLILLTERPKDGLPFAEDFNNEFE